MSEIPADVLDIAAVVTGAERLPLTGWQRTQAIRAMHALGYNRDYIADALCIERRQYVNDLARRLGISFHNPDQEPDLLAVEFVCTGTRMPLAGADRDEAIRRLAARGKTSTQMAHLLCTTSDVITDRAARIGVKVQPGKKQGWWVSVACPAKTRTPAAA